MRSDGTSAENSAGACAVSPATGHFGLDWNCSNGQRLLKLLVSWRLNGANVPQRSHAAAALACGQASRIDIFLQGTPFSVHAGIAFANRKPSRLSGPRRSMKVRHNEGTDWPRKPPGTRSWRPSPPYQRQSSKLRKALPAGFAPGSQFGHPKPRIVSSANERNLVTVPHNRALASDLGPRFATLSKGVRPRPSR
jgi:hypothetical protein